MNILDNVYYGNTLLEWCISLLVLFGAFVLNELIKFFWRKVIKAIVARSKMRLDDIFCEALERPLFMGIYLIAIWIAVNRLHLSESLHEIIAKSYQVLNVLVITWFVARLAVSLAEARIAEMAASGSSADARHASHTRGRKFHIDAKFLPLIKRSLLIVIWLIGLLTAAHNAGLNITALAGALGISGIAFALASQDTIKNIFAGVTIFSDGTFRIGDIIRFDTAEGTVVDISLRSTRIRTYDKQIITIPNYKLTETLITNISSEPGRRVVVELGLTYGTSPEKMQEAINILKDMPHRVHDVKDSDLAAFFSAYGESALVITFIYFIRHSADKFETRSKVNFEILRAFNQAGLNFAFPSRTIYIENT